MAFATIIYMDLLLNFGDVRCIFVPFEFRLSLCHNQQKDIFYFLPFLDSPITKNGSCLELYFDNDACFLHHWVDLDLSFHNDSISFIHFPLRNRERVSSFHRTSWSKCVPFLNAIIIPKNEPIHNPCSEKYSWYAHRWKVHDEYIQDGLVLILILTLFVEFISYDRNISWPEIAMIAKIYHNTLFYANVIHCKNCNNYNSLYIISNKISGFDLHTY